MRSPLRRSPLQARQQQHLNRSINRRSFRGGAHALQTDDYKLMRSPPQHTLAVITNNKILKFIEEWLEIIKVDNYFVDFADLKKSFYRQPGLTCGEIVSGINHANRISLILKQTEFSLDIIKGEINVEECSPLPITTKYKELIIIDKYYKVILLFKINIIIEVK